MLVRCPRLRAVRFASLPFDRRAAPGRGSPARADEAVLPLSEVRPGMEGKGRTVFEGARVDEFGVTDPRRPRERARPAAEHHPRPPRRRPARRDRRHRRDERQPGVRRRQARRRGGLRLPVRQGADRGHHADRRDGRGHPDVGAAGGVDALPRGGRGHAARAPRPRVGEGRAAAAAARGRGRGGSAASCRPRSPGPTLNPLALPLVFSGFDGETFDWARGVFSAMGFAPMLGGRRVDGLARADARPRARRRGRHLAHRGRHRPVGHRHDHAHRPRPRLRLRPSVLQPRPHAVPDEEGLGLLGVPEPAGLLEDRRRDRRRRHHGPGPHDRGGRPSRRGPRG